MDTENWVLALINSTAFLLCVLFTSYIIAVLRPFLARREVALGDREQFQWHIIVPCLNEQAVVADCVDHLIEVFPEATLWLVDDASDDRTPTLLAWLTRRYPSVHVVERRPPDARQGKGPALNAAWRQISAYLPPDTDRGRVIVGVVDADGRLEAFCPDVISGDDLFGDPAVGAVQIQVRVTADPDALTVTDIGRLTGDPARSRDQDLLIQLQDMEFVGPIAAMQFLRRRTGSVAMGGNGQFTRMSTLDTIAATYGTPWSGALLEDFELGLHVLLSGYRSEYCHDTFVAQAGLTQPRALLRQRTRWAQGNLQCLKYLWQVANSPHIRVSGVLEIGYYLAIPFTQITGSVVFPLSALVYVAYMMADPAGSDRWLLTGALGVLPLALAFGVLPHAAWGLFYRSRCAGMITRRRAWLLAVANLAYSYFLQAAAWRGLFRLLRGRSDWAKTARAADDRLPARARREQVSV
ncbi:glycosyltransferase family 2 protein [Mangrovihabitans endophyticus]|uniref:N-acetyl-glucosamine transferase n=1 Tax=Mangrovihabitans endophyticus TaxID=1751298 RepID=A0A8J3C3X0_9ACTN|nr:glycosyltransferase [Mangrovihabitans endophyticus]GGL07009.1 N-acetyl-glucosamine transferase [Mangrovihabitans endophyticus]